MFRPCCGILMALLTYLPGKAEIVYSNDLVATEVSGMVGSTIERPRASAFNLQETTRLSSARILGLYLPNLDNIPPQTDNFSFVIYEDAAHSPSALCCPDPSSIIVSTSLGHLSRNETGFNLAGRDIYDYELPIASVTLASNQWYWLSVTNESSETWGWALDTNRGDFSYSNDGGNTWARATGRVGFTLYGTVVPEPSGAILSFCFFAAAMLRRKRVST